MNNQILVVTLLAVVAFVIFIISSKEGGRGSKGQNLYTGEPVDVLPEVTSDDYLRHGSKVVGSDREQGRGGDHEKGGDSPVKSWYHSTSDTQEEVLYSQYLNKPSHPYTRGPVRAGTLMATNDYYNRFYETSPLNRYVSGNDFYPLTPPDTAGFYDSSLKYHSHSHSLAKGQYEGAGSSEWRGTFSPHSSGETRFFSSSGQYSPLPTASGGGWEKMGIVTPTDQTKSGVLNLYRKAIAPAQDLYQYMVQDKDGFIISLPNQGYLDTGDIVGPIDGMPEMGTWTVKNYINNRYVFTW